MRPSLKVNERAVLMPILEGERARGVDAEHRDAGQFDERAQGVVDEPAVAGERGEETAEHVVKRHIVIARNPEHVVAALAQSVEKFAGVAKLLGPRTLGEVTADDDEVRFQFVDLPIDGLDQPLVVGAEMEV
jgi:hypothetical protein